MLERTTGSSAWSSLEIIVVFAVALLMAILVTVTHKLVSVPLQNSTTVSLSGSPAWVMLLVELLLLEFKFPNWDEVQLKFHVLMSLATVKLSWVTQEISNSLVMSLSDVNRIAG